MPAALRTHCPFKGNARYWHVVVGNTCLENAVWSYETPAEGASEIEGLLAFNWDAMDACWADGEQIIEPAGVVIDAPNPHAMWLMHAADRSLPPERMLAAFATHLREQGFPLLRLGVLVRTSDPLVFAWGGLDWRDRSAPETFEMPYEVLRAEELRLSPYAPILGGEGGVRRRIDPRARADFPILEDLARRGATDYAAMPMQFSDGQINILTLVADGAEGFTTDQRGPMHEVLPLLSSIFEVYSHRHPASVFMGTYLGRQTGTGVLAGKVRRGDSEAIHAVVWFSDLRASTRLTEALGRHEYLELLNDFFDCMAGAVLAYKGEVLKYIGDAVMANLLWLIRTNYAQSRRLLRSPLPATHLLAWIASTARAVSAALIPLASASRCIGASSPTKCRYAKTPGFHRDRRRRKRSRAHGGAHQGSGGTHAHIRSRRRKPARSVARCRPLQLARRWPRNGAVCTPRR